MTTDALRQAARHAARSRASWYLLLVPAIAAFIVADVAVVWVALHGDWAFDFTCCYQQAAQRLVDGSQLYDWSETYTFRYSPWAALLFAPLVPLSAGAAAAAWFAVKLVAVAGAAWWYARPWAPRQRIAVAAAVVLFPPVVHDLLIGNISVFTVIVLLALSRETRAGPPLLGLLFLLAPKPHLLPVAAWLLVRRPRDAGIAAAVAVIGAAAGVAVFGLDSWVAYLGTFREPLGRDFTANIGLSGLLGPLGVAVSVVSAVVVFVLSVRRPGADGLSLAIVSGVLVGPYLFIHYLAGVIVAVEPMLRRAPGRLAAFPPLIVVAFPLTAVWLVLLAAVQYLSSRKTIAWRAGLPGGSAR